MSARATLIAVIAAFLVGGVATLAIRPPTHQSSEVVETGTTSIEPLEAISWQLPVSFQTSLEVLGDNIVYIQGAVSDLTGGQFQLQIYEPNEIVPPLEISGAVRTGKVPIGYTWLGYDQGKDPCFSAFWRSPLRDGAMGVFVLVV